MKKLVPIMALLAALLLNACQAPIFLTPTLPPGNFPATSPAPATPITEQSPAEEAVTPSAIGQKMAQISSAALAKSLLININQVQVVKVTPVNWRDASLGCPKPGIDYIQVETPGYRVSLQAQGKLYEYHTDQTSRVVQCAGLKP